MKINKTKKAGLDLLFLCHHFNKPIAFVAYLK